MSRDDEPTPEVPGWDTPMPPSSTPYWMRGGAPFPDRPGAVYVATVQRGAAEVCVYPLLFGGGRILLGPTGDDYDGGGNETWDYEVLADAVQAAHDWNGVGAPANAYRHTVGNGRPEVLRPLAAR